jgi:hypothetical protein
MPLTLEQYANYLDSRDLNWPAPPSVDPPKAKAHLVRLPALRAVIWNVYGTLLAISGGDLLFEHPQQFVMDIALDKTVQEFKMWNAMFRKPVAPAEQLRQAYTRLLDEQRVVTGSADRTPEVCAATLWAAWVRKLLQKEYAFDCSFYGSLNEYSQKMAYFFHASLQGTSCYPSAVTALRHVARSGLFQGLAADGQCFTVVQLQRGVSQQDPAANLSELIDPSLRVLSYELRERKPSERIFRSIRTELSQRGIKAEQILHVGSRISQDIVPARRAGMKTALFAGDKASLQASKEQLKDPLSRPDVLLTSLDQLLEVVG